MSAASDGSRAAIVERRRTAVRGSRGGRGRAGDPVEFTVRVDGEANVGLLPRPSLAVPWADVIESGDRVEIDSGSAEVRGAKEFTWLLTPRAPGAFATPAIRYPYFDPAIGRYETLVVPPVRVDAAPSAGAPPVAAFDGARPAPTAAAVSSVSVWPLGSSARGIGRDAGRVTG